MSSSQPSSTPLLRARGVARILGALADTTSAEHLALRACQAARAELDVAAAALFVGRGDDGPDRAAAERLAADGLTRELPEDLPGTLEAAGIDRLHAWAHGAGFARVELAPLDVADPAVGVLALFATADAAPIEVVDLAILGAGLGHALRRLRAPRESHAGAGPAEREHDQLVRAERMRALGDMALGIAHDFNNVLNAILAQTGTLMALVGDSQPATSALDRLRAVALAGAATTQRVQEFSGQRRDRDFAPVALPELVAAAAAELRTRVPPGVRVDVDLGAVDSALVLGTAAELGELLGELADNALQASGESGVIALELRVGGDHVTLVVRDAGSGMSPIVRRRAFDPFFTTRPRAQGLGLSVAWGIVRRHGGIIDLDSRIGHGTTVRIRLPIAAVAHPPQPDAPAVAAPVATSSRRVLLVEDDADNREAMATLLSLSGFEVTVADCGSAGIRAFAPGRFDIVLTDLGLPDLDGWEVAGAIKKVAPTMPIALITGWGLNLDSSEIRRRGVDLLVKKPLDPRSFVAQIEALAQAGGRSPSA